MSKTSYENHLVSIKELLEGKEIEGSSWWASTGKNGGHLHAAKRRGRRSRLRGEGTGKNHLSGLAKFF